MYFNSALSFTKLEDARSLVFSTSDRYSRIRSGVESVSGNVHSKGSSQRLAVIPPNVCSTAPALLSMFSPMVCEGGWRYNKSTGTDLVSIRKLSPNEANSRSRRFTTVRSVFGCFCIQGRPRISNLELRTLDFVLLKQIAIDRSCDSRSLL